VNEERLGEIGLDSDSLKLGRMAVSVLKATSKNIIYELGDGCHDNQNCYH
jgi:hypothetical protein